MDVDSVISRRRKILPGRTILQTKESFPIIDNSSFFVHFLRSHHIGRTAIISKYFSSGMLMVDNSESMSMPKYVIFVDGVTSLSSAIGMPKC